VREVPGVLSAAVGTMNPPSGWLVEEDRDPVPPGWEERYRLNRPDGGFETTGIRRWQGDCSHPAIGRGLCVAMLNESRCPGILRRRKSAWPKVSFGTARQDEFEIVGVVADSRYKDPNAGRAHGIPAAEQAIVRSSAPSSR
jgi:hypothetical protein